MNLNKEGGMVMKERIKNWFKRLFRTKYIIVRNEVVLWKLLYVDRTETKYILASSELLSEVKFLDSLVFSKVMKRGYQSSAIWSWILMKILINRNGKDYRYKRIQTDDLVFRSDLTG